MFTDIIILAGGFGERLWPASCADTPKQFMTLKGNISFLQDSLLRALALQPEGKIIIATRKDLENKISLQVAGLIAMQNTTPSMKKKLKEDTLIIAEPFPRHTTAPLELSCWFLNIVYTEKKHNVLVLTSDHIIKPLQAFCNDCNLASKATLADKFLCFAIPPLSASTDYGYIKIDQNLSTSDSIYKIDNFKEKPDAQTAEEYLQSGQYWWNSGMFGFNTDFFLSEMEKCTSEIASAFLCMKNSSIPVISTLNGIKYIKEWPEMNAAYNKTPAIAIDIAMAEKTQSSYAVRSTFEWDDVGSWDSFEKHSCMNDDKVVSIESSNCFVYSDIPVALCGVSDISVVIKNGKALILKKGQSHLVRNVAKNIKI